MADRLSTGAPASCAAACAHSPSLIDRSPSSLSTDAQDNAGDLRTTLQAYCAVEKLMTCHGAHDSQNIVAHRDELGALLRLLNERFAQNLDTLDTSLQALHGALRARETLQ